MNTSADFAQDFEDVLRHSDGVERSVPNLVALASNQREFPNTMKEVVKCRV